MLREIIKLIGWIDGSCWGYMRTYSDNIVDVPMTDWSWYELPEENPEDNGEDIKIIVEYYAEDAEPGYDEPLASYSKWVSELYAEGRKYENRKNHKP